MSTATLQNGSYKILKLTPKEIQHCSIMSKITTDKTVGNLRFVDYRPGEGIRHSLMISSLKGFGSEVKRAFKANGDPIHIQVLSLGKSFTIDLSQPISLREVHGQLHCSMEDVIILSQLISYLYKIEIIEA